MKRIPALLLIFSFVLALAACAEKPPASIETDKLTTPVTEAPAAEKLTIATADGTDYVIVISDDCESYLSIIASDIKGACYAKTSKHLWVKRSNTFENTDCEILIGDTGRPESDKAAEGLKETEYRITVIGKKLVVAGGSDYAAYKAAIFLCNEFFESEGDKVEIPMNYDIKGEVDVSTMTVISSIEKLRDPCIVVENGVYYAYGTGWHCYKNTSGELSGKWSDLGVCVTVPETCLGDKWAPEVHKYNGAFYMFTTYKSSETNKRGCTILKADDPTGPFVEITDGIVTPHEWDCIDGTLYVDETGQPWMVFVHEWVSAPGNIGTFAAAKLSDDLTHFISEPFELFAANEPSWATGNVTDGCWMYTTEDGQLLMLWSNTSKWGYCVGISRSSNGRLDGKWTHDEKLLFSKEYTGDYDGGHGMLFKALNGQTYLAVHSPNSEKAGRKETPIFVPVVEKNGTLVWADKQ